MHLVDRQHLTEGVLPLTNAFAADVELLGDLLSGLTGFEGPDQPLESVGTVPLDEVAGDAFTTGGHGVPR